MKIDTSKKVDLIEAYEASRNCFPVGSIIPLYLQENKEPAAGLVIGHVFANTRKSKKKLPLLLACRLVVFYGSQYLICSIHDKEENVIAIADINDKFVFKEWKNDKFIVEVPEFLQEKAILY